MNQDPLDLLRSSIDESLSPVAAERVWHRAKIRNRDLGSGFGWASRLVAAIAVGATVAVSAPSFVTSSPTDVSVEISSSHTSTPASKPLVTTPEVIAVAGTAVTCDVTREQGSDYSAALSVACPLAVHGYLASFKRPFYSAVNLTSAHEVSNLLVDEPRRGVQLCASVRNARVLVVPAETLSGRTIPCENFLP